MFASKFDKISDLIWSPFDTSEFVAYGSDLYLYRLKNNKSKTNDLPVSDECVAELLASYGENSNPRVVSWYPRNEADYLFAVSFANQKIQLINVNNSSNNNKNFEIRKEFYFKQTRQCNNLMWNPLKPNYLAAGFEKMRLEHSIIIWDLNGFKSNQDYNAEPLIAFSTSQTETCNSFSWYPDDENLLIAGLNNNALKLFDLRVNSRVVKQTNTKYVNSICMDPCPHIAASYYENQIAIWDTRLFEKPLQIIQEHEPITKIQWCQKKAGKLASLVKNSNDISLFSIKSLNTNININLQNDEYSQRHIYVDKTDRVCVTHPKDKQYSNVCLKSFCWSNSDASKILVVDTLPNPNFKILSLVHLTAMEWSPNGEFCWSSNMSRINQIDYFYECDLSNEFKEKAKYNYGLKYESLSAGLIICDFQHNIKCCNTFCFKNDISYLWHWFDTVNHLFDFSSKNQLNYYFSFRYNGLRNLLDEFLNKKSTTNSDLSDIHEKFKAITFNLCEWNYKDGSLTREFFNRLEQTGQYERAICLAIMLDYHNYTDIMDSALKKEPRFGYIWVALKCLLVERHENNNKSMSKDSLDSSTNFDEYEKLAQDFTNPYLRSLFNYVLFKDDAIKSILNDKNLQFQDRIALAVHFLFDKEDELKTYFDNTIEECVKNVNINGVLLTGLSTKCINLFQSYIDKTSDIQTIALAIIHTTFQDVIQNKQVKYWMDCYRELLNKWRLWDIRAMYDNLCQKIIKSNNHIATLLQQLSSDKTVNQQLAANSNIKLANSSLNFLNPNVQKFAQTSLLCNNCGKNILEKIQNRVSNLASHNSNFSSSRLNIEPIQGCADCGKFLPQCSICLQFMVINPSNLLFTSHANTIQKQIQQQQSPKTPSIHLNNTTENESYKFLMNSKFGNLFSWCMNCKHGGHLKHLAEWFNLHTKCPFPHCKCNCLQLDII